MKCVLLTAAVLAFFAFGYFLMDRIDRFLCENQRAIQNEKSDSKSSQILLSSDLTDDEIKVNQTLVDSKETDAELIKSLKATIKELKENHGKLSRESWKKSNSPLKL